MCKAEVEQLSSKGGSTGWQKLELILTSPGEEYKIRRGVLITFMSFQLILKSNCQGHER